MVPPTGRTFRVPLVHAHPDQSEPGTTVAPYAGGRLSLHGERHDVPFLVDTGADFSALNPNLLPGDLTSLFREGEEPDGDVGGLGGVWPARVFHEASLVLTRDRGPGLRLELPRLYLLAAYRHVTGDDEVQGRMNLPTDLDDRPPRLLDGPRWMECRFPHLLGRDALSENRSRLDFDPVGASYLYVRVAS